MKILVGPSSMDIEINKIESGQTFELNNIYFATDSFNLNTISRSIFNRVF